jgi:hypothetical protein
MGSCAQKFIQSLASQRSRGFLLSAAMKSQALESHMYGDPLEVYAAKQSRERRAAERSAQPVKCPTLTLRRQDAGRRWSAAREAAEALFDFPAADHS